MERTMSKRFEVGDYVVENQIGWGSFSTVWRAQHRVHGTVVAIKEIVMARLDQKLQQSLKSEIVILKTIDHPNIIRLHDIIEESGKIYIVLEYCKGGDLSVYIRKCQGRIPEATATHFMQQLASGLNILRKNNLIHRDLKPQNLLLSTNDDSPILKIADFGFARSLQPRKLAETLCGSPLYMAPEIMQLQKYDAKADLWSVGAILFQLVTGKVPFTGNNYIQLLQNILKSTELQFPPDIKDLSRECIDLCRKLLRHNPVERLTFEEFFNHPFLSQWRPDDTLRNRRSQRVIDGFPIPEFKLMRNLDEVSQEDCLPFSLNDDAMALAGSPSFIWRSALGTTHGFSPEAKTAMTEAFNTSNKTDIMSKIDCAPLKPEDFGSSLGSFWPLEGNLTESRKFMDYTQVHSHLKEMDLMELVDLGYVLVYGPPVDSSSSAGASKLSSFPSKSGSPPRHCETIKSTASTWVPINNPAVSKVGILGELEFQSFAPVTPEGSMDMLDTVEKPSTDCITRIKSLKRCASVITELVDEKIEEKKHLEAFSIQLVVLAIWKQVLDIFRSKVVFAIEGSPAQDDTKLREIIQERSNPDILGSLETADMQGPSGICFEIERAFLLEVGNAEELANAIGPEGTEMPDAMELIYEAALDLGKHGAVKEYMGVVESAEVSYSKAVLLLLFLLVEAPSLILNPPFSLTNSGRYRLWSYIDLLNNRQSISRS